jgi:hypothetical protein
MCPQQREYPAPQPLVAGAGGRHEGFTLRFAQLVQRGNEDRGFGHDHGPSRVEVFPVVP